jgi:MoaA/NifB/PqqE/SkfB family radical SAM enzyme
MHVTGNQYSNPPILIGYTYEAPEAYAARDQRRLLSIRIETNASCNLRCRYCYAESGGAASEADLFMLKDCIIQAQALGIKSVVVIGGGEPTMYSHFRELIAFIDSLNIIPMIFTNGILIDRELARFLYDHHASVMGKLDSLRPEVQDYLAGVPGATTTIRKGLRFLAEAGFTETADSRCLRMGISFVSNRMNVEEIKALWHFCRRNNMFPNMEILTPTGRAREQLAEAGLTKEEVQRYKKAVLKMDQEIFGYNWLPYTPLPGSGCLQHFYSMYITLQGDVRPCAPVKFDQHPAFHQHGAYPYNLHRATLREIYDAQPFQIARTIDGHLEGKCCKCSHLDECIGCRGYAYSVGVNKGMAPLDALRMECQQCCK